jgi:hypothetical protein
MSPSLLHDLEARIALLSPDDKQRLLDRLTQDLHPENTVTSAFAATLAMMAADPDIQREIRDIEREFADTAEDGLENL